MLCPLPTIYFWFIICNHSFIWGFKTEMWSCIDCWIVPNIRKGHSAHIIRGKQSKKTDSSPWSVKISVITHLMEHRTPDLTSEHYCSDNLKSGTHLIGSILAALNDVQIMVHVRCHVADKPYDSMDWWQFHLQHQWSLGECHALFPEWNVSYRWNWKTSSEEYNEGPTFQLACSPCASYDESWKTFL